MACLAMLLLFILLPVIYVVWRRERNKSKSSLDIHGIENRTYVGVTM
jgi:hypothetical protein